MDGSVQPDANDASEASQGADAPQETSDSGGCLPKTCAQLSAECGTLPDGCSSTVSCGDCTPGLTCGGGGPNKCGTQPCQPKTCAQLGTSCGFASDGCGSALTCGDCPACQTCVAGVCNGQGPSCAGKVCGDDGCGGSCGTCGAGQVCSSGQCGCDPALPAGWPVTLGLWDRNPVLMPTAAAALQGQDNVYAPDILSLSSMQLMLYGAQGSDGHDRIYAAWSSDGGEWRKYPSDGDPQPVLDRGSSNHVNDPSTVQVGATWRMYYTDAPTAENDRIWLAESTTLTTFQKTQEVLGPVAGTWEADKVGRPSVLVEGGVYKMWYDGTGNGQRHVGFASSSDGVHFTRHPGNPIFLNAGAIDVKKIGNVYVMLREGGDGTYWATSVDGLCWVDRGKMFGLSGKAYDAYGQVTPFLQVEGGALRGVWFGGASVNTWNKNRIAVAWVSGASVPAGGGCTGCLPGGSSCSEACHGGGMAHGTCGAPGSVDPGVCCACSAEGCEACTAAADCHAACVGAGKLGGFCAHPGSSDPGVCCACLP